MKRRDGSKREDPEEAPRAGLEPGVVAEAMRRFSPEDARYVLSRLSSLKPDPYGRPLGPRIQIALIWLSRGSTERFEEALKDAYIDWRDTLVAAGLETEDWRAVLAARGVRCDGW